MVTFLKQDSLYDMVDAAFEMRRSISLPLLLPPLLLQLFPLLPLVRDEINLLTFYHQPSERAREVECQVSNVLWHFSKLNSSAEFLVYLIWFASLQ